MKYITRQKAMAFFILVEAFLFILAIVFNVPAHYLRPISIGVAILAVGAFFILPPKPAARRNG
jgi:hypothetical protein